MLQHARQSYVSLQNLDQAWQGVMLGGKRHIAVKMRMRSGAPLKSHFALDNFESSACLVWPCEFLSVPGRPNEEYFELQTDLNMPSMVSVCDVRPPNIQACRVKWRAPMNQWHDYPRLGD